MDTCVERVLSKVWIWLIIVGVIGVVFYVIYNYNLKLFNFRGSIWYFSFMGFLDGTLWQKLMGVGPALLDTVTQAQIAKADFYVEWNWLYCTAHNDLLEYLVRWESLVQPVSSLCIFCRLSCMQGAKNVSRKRQRFWQRW